MRGAKRLSAFFRGLVVSRPEGWLISSPLRPILAEQFPPARLARSRHSVTKYPDGAVAVGPIDICERLAHQRAPSLDQRCPRDLIAAHDKYVLHRVLYGVAETRVDLRVETRVLVQSGRQQERPEEFAGRVRPISDPNRLAYASQPWPKPVASRPLG